MPNLKKSGIFLSALGALFTLTTNTSLACTPPSNNKWYEKVRWYNAPWNQAVYTSVDVANGQVTNYAQGGFIAQVMWEATNNQGDPGINWVEAGYTYGFSNQNVLTYYFADGRPCGSWGCSSLVFDYHEHRVTSVTPSTGGAMPIQITYVGGNSWDVLFNGQIQTATGSSGTVSTNNPPYSGGMACGIENSGNNGANNFLIGSSCNGLKYWDLSGNPHNWGGTNPSSGTSAVVENYCGGSAYWLSAGSDLATDFG